MRILALLVCLSLLGCRREHIKVEHTVVEKTTSDEVHTEVQVDTFHVTTKEPDRIVEEGEVLVFDAPSREHPDAKPVLREIRKTKKVTETGAKKEDLRVAWHGISDQAAKTSLRVWGDTMEHDTSKPSMGFDLIGWVISALLVVAVLYIAWAIWPRR